MRDKDWRNGRRTPTQDPSTNTRWLCFGAGKSLLCPKTLTVTQAEFDVAMDAKTESEQAKS